MLYSIVGVPLLMVTTADCAKFISNTLTTVYTHYLAMKMRVSTCINDRLPNRWQQQPADDQEEVSCSGGRAGMERHNIYK
jgi:hypothetical protein